MNEEDKKVPESGPPRIEPPKEEAVPYALEPEPPKVEPARAAPARPAEPKAGRVGDGSFMDDMPEDADLEHDPEVERALKGEPSRDKTVDVDADKPRFVKEGGGEAKPLALVGLGLAVGAAITAAVRSSDHWFASGALAIYMTLLHSVTGIAAAAGVAYFEREKFGRVDLAGARMLVAVAVAYLVFSAGAGAYNAVTAPLGALLYLVVVGVLFRFPMVRLVRVAALHLMIVVAVYVAMMLYAAAKAPVAAAG